MRVHTVRLKIWNWGLSNLKADFYGRLLFDCHSFVAVNISQFPKQYLLLSSESLIFTFILSNQSETQIDLFPRSSIPSSLWRSKHASTFKSRHSLDQTTLFKLLRQLVNSSRTLTIHYFSWFVWSTIEILSWVPYILSTVDATLQYLYNIVHVKNIR